MWLKTVESYLLAISLILSPILCGMIYEGTIDIAAWSLEARTVVSYLTALYIAVVVLYTQL